MFITYQNELFKYKNQLLLIIFVESIKVMPKGFPVFSDERVDVDNQGIVAGTKSKNSCPLCGLGRTKTQHFISLSDGY